MGRPAYKVTDQDLYIVYHYLERAMARGKIDSSLRQSLNRVEDSGAAMQAWCEQHVVHTTLWNKLKNAVLAARKRARDGDKGRKRPVDLDPPAYSALQRLRKEMRHQTGQALTYSQVIELAEDMYYRAVAKKVRPDLEALTPKSNRVRRR